MSNSESNKIETNEVRAGRKVKGMSLVLGISTLSALILLAMVFLGKVAL